MNRRIRDRIRLQRSDNYWDRENVQLEHRRRALGRRSHDGLNLYMTGMIDWVTVPPAEVLRELLKS